MLSSGITRKNGTPSQKNNFFVIFNTIKHKYCMIVEEINDDFAEYQEYLAKKDKRLKLLVGFELDISDEDLKF